MPIPGKVPNLVMASFPDRNEVFKSKIKFFEIVSPPLR
jgi:hypothetical protein